MTPFKRGLKFTQLFGVNSAYYSQFGLKGHEGLDIVPADEKGNVLPLTAGTDNWDVLAVEDGEVVRDFDTPTGAYGLHVVVLNKSTGRAWWYCHLQRNDVALGQQVKRGDRLGLMGNTGNSSGAHLHLGLRLADSNGNALNTDNGYKGFVDPKEPLDSFNKNSPFPPVTPTPPTPPPVDYKAKYEAEVKAHEETRKQRDDLAGKLSMSENKLSQSKSKAQEIVNL